jgi:hypothetical protein
MKADGPGNGGEVGQPGEGKGECVSPGRLTVLNATRPGIALK